jgi:tetratricopeptide (TPR) repeat protein
MRNKLLTLFLLLLFFKVVNGQQLFYQKQDQTITVAGRDAGLNNDTRNILNKLAEGQNRPSSSVELSVQYQQTLKVVRNSKTMITVSVEASNIKVTGDVFYKGFDIADVLAPSEINFNYSLLLPSTSQRMQNGSGSVKISNGNSTVFSFQYTDSVNQNWSLTLDNLRAVFSSASVKVIDDRILLVKDYYGASAQLDQLHNRLLTVNVTDLENLDMHNAALVDIEYTIGLLEAKKFESVLSLATYDPLRFADRLETLRKETAARRMAINEVKRTVYLHFYNIALDLQARGKIERAKEYFMRSLSENPNFAPAAYQLALIHYREGNILKADDLGTDIVQCMTPDPDIYRLTIDLLNDIYLDLIDESGKLVQQKNFSDALLYLDRANNLCESVKGVRCDERLTEGYSKAYQGIYQSKIGLARKAYQENNLTKAEDLAREAIRYRDRYSRYVPNADEANAVLKAIRQKKYENTITAGRAQVSLQQYDKALQTFKEADVMLRNYGLTPDIELPDLKKQAAKSAMFARINRANDFVKTNNLAEARKISKEVDGMFATYDLSGDNELVAKFNILRQNIFSQECVNAQRSLDDRYRMMIEAINKKNYLEADRLYKEADKLLQDYADCSLNSGSMRADHDSIIPAYVYQYLVKEAVDLQASKKMPEAVAKYREAERYYYQNEVSRFGLAHKKLLEVAADKGKDEYLVYLGNYYRGLKEYENSLEAYKILISRNTKPKLYSSDLYQLGIELAIRDKSANPSLNPKTKVLEYTSGNKALDKLGKGYKKGWKMNK